MPDSGYDNLRHSHIVCSGPGLTDGPGDDCPDPGIVLRAESRRTTSRGRLTSWTSPFRLEFGDLEGPDSPTTSHELDDAGSITEEILSGGGETYRTTTANFTRARLEDRTRGGCVHGRGV